MDEKKKEEKKLRRSLSNMPRLKYEAEVIITFKTGSKLRVMVNDDNFISEFKSEGDSFAIKDCETDDLFFVSKHHVLYIEVIRYE